MDGGVGSKVYKAFLSWFEVFLHERLLEWTIHRRAFDYDFRCIPASRQAPGTGFGSTLDTQRSYVDVRLIAKTLSVLLPMAAEEVAVESKTHCM